jgi:putative flippase GtrA
MPGHERPDGGERRNALHRIKVFIEKNELTRYVIAGALTTLFGFAVFALLRRVTEIGAGTSEALSIAAAIVFAYIVNKLYVFRSRNMSIAAVAPEFLKFAGGRVAAALAEYYGFIFLMGVASELVAKAVTQVVVLAMNYAVSKLLVFKGKR